MSPDHAESHLADRCRAAACRSCGRRGLEPVLDLGPMPHSDGLLDADDLGREEPRYPLEVAFCPDCTLVQILETVDPSVLFGDDYPYYSSFSDALLAHSRLHALDLVAERGLDGDSLVVELASNDGYLLRNFVEAGVPVLGIDPAPGPAAAARAAGVPTRTAFFTRELAEALRADGTAADVVIGKNVLAHVADTNGFVAGVRTILRDDGIAVFEFPYVRDLVDHGEFDTIYHEHLCYFSLHATVGLLERHGLVVTDVERLAIHGGSLRVTASPTGAASPAVESLLAEERSVGLDGIAYFRGFERRVTSIIEGMRDMLDDLAARGHTLAGYGAAAKGTIMLNAIGAPARRLEFVVDRNVHKQGRWIPGVRLPIRPVEALLDRRPDYTVILPWNFREEIEAQQAAYVAAGGRFIVPIPEPAVLPARCAA